MPPAGMNNNGNPNPPPNPGAALRASALRQSTTVETVSVTREDVAVPVTTSSGGSSSTVSDVARPVRPAGGFAYPNQNAAGGSSVSGAVTANGTTVSTNRPESCESMC